MSEHRGTFKFGRANQIPKAKMVTTRIPVKEGFSLSGTLWIPKAQFQKPCPQIAFTLSSGDTKARITSETIADIKLALLQAVEWISSLEDEMEEAQQEEFNKWLEIHEAHRIAIEEVRKEKQKKQGKTIKLKTKRG